MSSFEGTLLRITFSRCGGSPGGGSFEMDEIESNISEDEEETLEGEPFPVGDPWDRGLL